MNPLGWFDRYCRFDQIRIVGAARPRISGAGNLATVVHRNMVDTPCVRGVSTRVCRDHTSDGRRGTRCFKRLAAFLLVRKSVDFCRLCP
jgi:hypothetical protein